MATITLISTNAGKISYVPGDLPSVLLASIETWLTAHGWVMWDNAAGAGVDCYRAICKDTVTYKYMTIAITGSGATSALVTRCWESWDNAAHSGTNGSYTNNSRKSQLDATSGGIVYFFTKNRYNFYYHTSTLYSGSFQELGAEGVVEISRDTEADVAGAGIPPFGMLDTSLMYDVGTTVEYVIAFPRGADGITDQYAAVNNLVVLPIGIGGMVSVPATRYDLQDFIPPSSYKNAWDNLSGVWDVRFGKTKSANWDIRGHAFGLKILQKNAGSIFPGVDFISIKVDGDDFLDSSGSLTEFWLLPGKSTHVVAIPK